MNSYIKKIIDILSLIIIIILIIINAYIVFSKFVLKQSIPKIFKHSALIVVSGSMYPTIDIGDMIIIKEENQYNVQDIVTYLKDKNLITHRIVKKEGTLIFTKGDNNNVSDNAIKNENIEGKTKYIIKKVGIIIQSLKSKEVLIITILFVLIILTKEKINKQRGERFEKR